METQTELPFRVPEINGMKGSIKNRPEDFWVEEIPLYEPSGEGQHVYLRVTRSGMDTPEVKKHLKKLFDLPGVKIGFAGLKDKHAKTTQYFSLNLPNADTDNIRHSVENDSSLEIHSVARHRNKLRRGHLIGNRFRIAIQPEEEWDKNSLQKITKLIKERGLGNFYGPQRMGANGKNPEKGKRILLGKDQNPNRFKSRFLLNSYQSRLFNIWLTERIKRNWFDEIFRGDIAKKRDTGGLFLVEDPETDNNRLREREITYTGPIYGSDLWEAGGTPGDLEREIIEKEDLPENSFSEHGLAGSRRRAQVFPEDLNLTFEDHRPILEFSLPKGSYATVLLREYLEPNKQ